MNRTDVVRVTRTSTAPAELTIQTTDPDWPGVVAPVGWSSVLPVRIGRLFSDDDGLRAHFKVEPVAAHKVATEAKRASQE